MGNKAMMVAIVGWIVACSAAQGCSLTGYDHTAPPAVRDVIDNQFAKFEWASDIDRDAQGREWTWHYILNQGTAGLAAIWEKQGLKPICFTPFHRGCRLVTGFHP